jgi:hypothetical protein
LAANIKPNSLLLIHGSFHGGNAPESGTLDEETGLQAFWCPYDLSEGKVISDDLVYDLTKLFDPSNKLMFMIDACHTQGSLRALGSIDFENLTPEQLQEMREDEERRKFMRVKSRSIGVANELNLEKSALMGLNPKGQKIELKTKIAWGLFAAKEEQTGADYYEHSESKYYGALTYNFIQVVKSLNAPIGLKDLCDKVQARVKECRFEQDINFEAPEGNENFSFF